MTEVPPTGQTEPGGARPGGASPDGGSPRRGRRVLGALAVLGLVAAGVGLYGIGPRAGKHAAHTGACARSLDIAQALDPLSHGDVAAMMIATSPNDLRSVAFDTAEGRSVTIGSFKGQTILLNLWATWCVPCRAEMPALDRLQATLGSPHFSVVPVDVDTTRLERARAFLHDTGATHLKYYADTSADILQALHGKGLPTSVLVGPDGCEIGTMAGPATWDSEDAKALITRATAPAQGA